MVSKHLTIALYRHFVVGTTYTSLVPRYVSAALYAGARQPKGIEVKLITIAFLSCLTGCATGVGSIKPKDSVAVLTGESSGVGSAINPWSFWPVSYFLRFAKIRSR